MIISKEKNGEIIIMSNNPIKLKIYKTKYLIKRLEEEKKRLLGIERQLDESRKRFKWNNEHKIRSGITKWLFKPQTLNKGLVATGAGLAGAFIVSPAALPVTSIIFGSMAFFKSISLLSNGAVVIENNKRNKNFINDVDHKLRENEELQLFLTQNMDKLDKKESEKLLELLQKEYEILETSRDIMQVVLLDERHGLFSFTARALIKNFEKKLKTNPKILGDFPIEFKKNGEILFSKNDDKITKGYQLTYLNRKKQAVLTILGYNNEAEYFGRGKTLFEPDNKELITICELAHNLEKEIKALNKEEHLARENDNLKNQKESLEQELEKHKRQEELQKQWEKSEAEDEYIENGMAFTMSR